MTFFSSLRFLCELLGFFALLDSRVEANSNPIALFLRSPRRNQHSAVLKRSLAVKLEERSVSDSGQWTRESFYNMWAGMDHQLAPIIISSYDYVHRQRRSIKERFLLLFRNRCGNCIRCEDNCDRIDAIENRSSMWKRSEFRPKCFSHTHSRELNRFFHFPFSIRKKLNAWLRIPSLRNLITLGNAFDSNWFSITILDARLKRIDRFSVEWLGEEVNWTDGHRRVHRLSLTSSQLTLAGEN